MGCPECQHAPLARARQPQACLCLTIVWLISLWTLLAEDNGLSTLPSLVELEALQYDEPTHIG